MKATIESRLNLDYDASRVRSQFNDIIDFILFAKDENHLRNIVQKINADEDNDFFHFEMGFGGNHFWVKQKGFGERRIFVEL